MSLDFSKIEDFIGTKFESFEDFTGQKIQTLRYFDGGAHWEITVLESNGFLQIVAHSQMIPVGAPIVELEVFYSGADVRISSTTEGKQYLVLHPKGCMTGANLLCIARGLDGRLTASTTLGQVPKENQDTLVQEWFGDRE